MKTDPVASNLIYITPKMYILEVNKIVFLESNQNCQGHTCILSKQYPLERVMDLKRLAI